MIAKEKILTRDEIVSKYAANNPIVYAVLSIQLQCNLTDDEIYRLLIANLLNENDHLTKVVNNYLQKYGT